MNDLTGKTALVTGASRGIGAATARELAARGARVLLAARTTDQIGAIADEIAAAGGTAIAQATDVADYASTAAAVGRACAEWGRLDILVQNAGVIDPIGHLVDSDPAEWAQASHINYLGVYYGLRAALPGMIGQGGGTIINVSSGAAHSPLEAWSHYCSAKAAAAMLTRCAHLEAGETVTVVGLSPGTVATYMQEAISASGLNPVSQLDWSAHVPPEWPAKAIAWLAGPAGREFAGEEVSLRDEGIRKRIGLI
jgi:NAD(P)-dependent dehydrogenase (short-subunit alcohol dehydrogenase family)